MPKELQEKIGIIRKVSGPLVIASGMEHAKMFDVVKVGKRNLIGEIIEIHSDEAYIQVYEETGGMGPGEEVVSTNEPLSVILGPGLLTSIYDGIQRPLDKIKEISGDYITRGINVPGIDLEKKWNFTPVVKSGAEVQPGDIIGKVQETD
ncbi:MAG TPA: V-type ATP synthase subunit A, partial [Firmicutes bacterium]|nr:V-type ATP synthase subunit A [Bacillota bacterium]